ncbi:MAG: uridine diphosphate-N-acetylglucosamine-binding protein YvcK [Erysipelotrichaceae bacterium]|nr:uridine diphosphate-N-acetylglucosamine-binding protein YvcK [Erysipelotrichaceae bacterium]
MKKVVVIGGGTGQSVMLRGLKKLEDIHLSTIVTVADDGGSTGRLRRSYHIPAMGDIRNVLIALSESEPLLTKMMDYRFEKDDESDVAGHNLGNLMLTALIKSSGSLMQAISDLSKVLKIKGEIIPASSQAITLCARMSDNTIVRGESNIPKYANRIQCVFYQEEVKATTEAISAVLDADVIIFGIGSLYTSIIPNIVIDDLKEALLKSDATKIYLCNAMTQPGETDDYYLEDHVQAIEEHLKGMIDLVVYANDILPPIVLERYIQQQAFPVLHKEVTHHYQIEEYQLLSFEHDLIRHDSEKIRIIFSDILKRVGKK